MTSLQKESGWEQSFDENFPDFGWCLRTDVGVNPSKDRVKSFIKEAVEVALVKGYEDGYKIGHWEGFEEGRNFGLVEREKEIAEEAKKKINSAGGLGGWKHLDDILNEIILKH